MIESLKIWILGEIFFLYYVSEEPVTLQRYHNVFFMPQEVRNPKFQ